MESNTAEKMVAIRETTTASEGFGHLERLKLERERRGRRGRNGVCCGVERESEEKRKEGINVH